MTFAGARLIGLALFGECRWFVSLKGWVEALMCADYDIRLAAPNEAPLLASHRVAMFREMGRTTPGIEAPLFESCAAYLRSALSSGEYVGWVAHVKGRPVGGAGVQFRPLIPRPDPAGRILLAGREGLIVNVYVDPAHRRQGIARRLMEHVIAWAPGAGIVRLVLHASSEGRRLYESLGFAASNEMLFPPFPPNPTNVEKSLEL